MVLAASEEEDFVQPFFEPNQTTGKQEVKTDAGSVSAEQVEPSAVSTPYLFTLKTGETNTWSMRLSVKLSGSKSLNVPLVA